MAWRARWGTRQPWGVVSGGILGVRGKGKGKGRGRGRYVYDLVVCCEGSGRARECALEGVGGLRFDGSE